jgi:hypothetical protein
VNVRCAKPRVVIFQRHWMTPSINNSLDSHLEYPGREGREGVNAGRLVL